MNSYLFICHGGKIRSPTAESVAQEIARRKGIEIKTQIGAMGIIQHLGYPESLAKEFNRYTKIIVMEEYMADALIKHYNIPKDRVCCINVEEDDREKNDEGLREEIKKKLENLIE